MKSIYIISFLVLLAINGLTQNRPKIGLTLSGGGAKGLAHIGILKAIDSAGLKVDYLTGTSMGSVIGGLYAAGYSADTIEHIARNIDWDIILSNQSASLRSIFMEEKDEYGKYVLELPWQNHKFNLPTGILESQELWLKFSELFFPVSSVKDFSKLSIPFKCIATDVGTGEAIVLDNGEIVSAIRPSMAIPSFFTAVKIDGRTLIDGGVTRNFPVQDVKAMGADYIIGSNVSTGLLASDKVRNAFQVLLQVAFFREAEDNKNEIPLCDFYIDHDMEKYNMGSFAQATDILEAGIEKGKEAYPFFKHLADSLNAVYGTQHIEKQRLPAKKDIIVSGYDIYGLKNTTVSFFINTLNLFTNKSYTAEEISEMVRKAFGTRYYNRIFYSFHPKPDGTYNIVFEVIENPLTSAKIGLHYNKFSGISAIVNFTSRNFISSNSRSLVSLSLGDNFRARAQHLQYIGRNKDFTFSVGAEYERFVVKSYSDIDAVRSEYRETGQYRRQYAKINTHLAFSPTRSFSTGVGFNMEFFRHSPIISAPFELKGSTNFPTLFAFTRFNSLNRVNYPTRGIKIDAEFGNVFSQYSSVVVQNDGIPSESLTDAISTDAYKRGVLKLESYFPLAKKFTGFVMAQGGVNLVSTHNLMNQFAIGGMMPIFANQITFAGLPEISTYANSVAAFMGGLRTQVYPNIYLTGKANVLFSNFINKSHYYNNPDFFSGYALTFGYNFGLGPLEISATYSDQIQRVGTFVSLGIPF